jgi:glutathione peroxidase-family protein
MRYICVEDNKVISVLEYSPSVPESVAVIEITEQDYENLEKGLAYFDIQSSSIISYPQEHFNNQQIEKNNAAEREFLNSTDWMVLRHLRQKFLGLNTTLSEQQYQELEQRRHESANRIVKINNQD